MQMHIRFFINQLPFIHLLEAIYSWVNLLLGKSASLYRSIEYVSSSAQLTTAALLLLSDCVSVCDQDQTNVKTRSRF